MSELRADTITSATDNTDLEIQARGTGVPNLESGFKVNGTVGVPVSALQTGTDGELITWDASGNPATVATGTAAQILTSNGAGAAPTFQTPAAAGSMEFISHTTLASDATITLTGLDNTAYAYFHIYIRKLRPSVDGILWYVRVGDSAGIDSGASNYGWHSTQHTIVAAPQQSWSTNDTKITITASNNHGGEADETIMAEIILERTTAADPVGPWLWGKCAGQRDSTGDQLHTEFYGLRNSAINLDRIQIYPGSGNWTTGEVFLYGVKNT
jgi:hypothetical protein